MEVHHKIKIKNWEKIIDMIYQELLINPEWLETLCIACHDPKPIREKETNKTTHEIVGIKALAILNAVREKK